MTAVFGYDPARIVALRVRTLDAIESLRALRSDDPLAAGALRAVQLLRHNLEDTWMPLLDAIHGSSAMTSWRDGRGLDGAITDLVRHLGATAPWIATFGLDDVHDRQLVDRLVALVDEVLRTVRDGDRPTSGEPVGLLTVVIAELARRARDDGGVVAGMVANRIGDDGLALLLAAVDAVVESHDLAIAPLAADDRRRLASALPGLLGAVLTSAPGTIEPLAETVASSSRLTSLLLAEPAGLGVAGLVAVTSTLLASFRADPGVTSRFVAVTADSPDAATQVLADDTALTAVATSRHLDPDAVEALLVAPAAGGHDQHAGLDLLRRLVGLAGGHELSDGARRGTARLLGGHLPLLAPQLDRRLPVVVPLDPTVRGLEVHVGEYEAVARLVGQVLDDRAAQLSLGVVVGAFRDDQVGRALLAVGGDDPPVDATAATAVVGAALADVTRVAELLTVARAGREELLAVRHGAARSRSAEIVSLLGTVAGWTLPGGPLVSRAAGLTTRAVLHALSASTPRRTPSTGLHADLAIGFTAAVLGAPEGSTRARAALGLANVPESTWRQVGRLLDELDRTSSHDERVRIHARLRALASSDPALDRYLESAAAASGEDAAG